MSSYLDLSLRLLQLKSQTLIVLQKFRFGFRLDLIWGS